MTSLHTGIKDIDDEHDRLLALEQRLRQASSDDGMSHVHNQILFELVEYMSEHFLHEEKLMHCLPAALRQSHKHEHAELSSRVVALMPSAKKAKEANVYRDHLADVISLWLREHIQEWDMPLAQALGAERNYPIFKSKNSNVF